MLDPLHLFEKLAHITARIEALNDLGRTSLGTGFFFYFTIDDNIHCPVLVTNKHVVENCDTMKVCLSIAKDEKSDFGNHYTWTISNVRKSIFGHPNPEIDLAIYFTAELTEEMGKRGYKPFIFHLSKDNIPTSEQIESFASIEEILMIGYPAGLWDRKNNLPIIRRGITATPYAIDYEGKQEFLIDAACYPGSSGSPILIANHGSFVHSGKLVMGLRFYLIGILWGGPQYTLEGEIVASPVPTTVRPISRTSVPTNLGFCIKSNAIMDFLPEVARRARCQD